MIHRIMMLENNVFIIKYRFLLVIYLYIEEATLCADLMGYYSMNCVIISAENIII